jgi:hypothetical protein
VCRHLNVTVFFVKGKDLPLSRVLYFLSLVPCVATFFSLFSKLVSLQFFFTFFYFLLQFFLQKTLNQIPFVLKLGNCTNTKHFYFQLKWNNFFFFKFRFLLQIDVFSHILEELNLFSRAKIFPFQEKNADIIPIKSSIDVIWMWDNDLK